MISDKKNELKALDIPDDIYQNIINDIRDTILEIDLKGKFTYVSPQCYQMFGYEPREVIGKSGFKFIHPDDLLTVMNMMKTVIKDKKHILYEYRAKHKKDGYIHVSAKGGIIKRNGTTKIIAVIRDITEKKKAEGKLKDSEHQYRTIIESMGDPMHLVDKDLRIIYINNSLKEWLTRFNIKENPVGKNISNVFPFLPESVKTEYSSVFKTGNTLISEELTHLNEKAIYTEVRKVPILIEGKVVQVLTIVKDVTEKKIAEKRITESEEKFRHLFNHSPYGILIFDSKGNLLDSNETLIKKFSHYARKDVIGKNFIEIISLLKNSKDLLKIFLKRYKAIRKGILLEPFEFFIEMQDGTIHWLYWEVSEVKISDRVCYQVTLQDITERKVTEIKLKKSEKEFQNIIENTNDAIIIIDFNGKLLYASPQLSLMLKGREIGTSSRFFQYIHKEDTQKLISYFQTTIEEKFFTEKYFEFRILPKHGDYIWFSSSSKSYYDDDGKVIGFISNLKDITDKKVAEQKLKESEQMYRLITEVSNDLIRVLNDKFETEYVNESSLKNLLGYTKQEILGRNSLFLNHPEDYTKVRRFMLNLFKNGENIHNTRVQHKNGHWMWYENKAKMFTDENGNQKYLYVSRDVTERIKAEKALKESEQKYRLITENSNDLIRVLNDKFEVEYVNESSLKNLLGYSKQEFQGGHSIRANHHDDYKKVRRFMLKLFKDGENVHTVRVQHKNGNWIWYENKAKMFSDELGNQKYLMISRDVTEKIKAEEALKESEQKYRLITENSNDLIRVLSEEFKIEFLNEKAHQQVLGYTRDDLIGNYDTQLFTPEDYPKLRRYMLKLFKNKEEIHVSRMRHRMGYYLWFEVKTKMFKDEQGKTKYLFISRDITERRQTEIALMESEEKYRNLYKNSPNAVLLTDKNGIILDVNSSAERILGYRKSELNGRNYIEFNMVTPNQITAIKKMFNQVLKGVKPKHIELQIKKKNGNMIWILFQSSMVKLNNEIIVECIAQDITDKKKAENLIIEENKRLLELNKMKTELISRVSHELKTPITSIFGGTQILLEVYKDQTCSEALGFIELINRGGKRLKVLIENLLDASRIESEKLQLNLQKENIVEVIKNCISDNRYLANKRNMIVELNMPEVVSTKIDKMRIEQVITNLLSNAIKNTPKKGIIKITLEEKGVGIYFKIEDTGIGLTRKEMETLFLKFGKIERYGQKMDVDIEGSGLGLYITKEIIDMHGGHIWVESEGRNKGSTFYFKLFKNMNGRTS